MQQARVAFFKQGRGGVSLSKDQFRIILALVGVCGHERGGMFLFLPPMSGEDLCTAPLQGFGSTLGRVRKTFFRANFSLVWIPIPFGTHRL